MNKELVANELLAVAEMLVGTTGTFKCPECGGKVLENTGYCVKCEKKVKQATTGTFKCPECGTDVLENTGYCVKCKKKVKEATTGTFECPECGTGVLENTGYCVKCKKKVKQAMVNPEDLARLPHMALNEIASLVYEDWKNVNYGAKPYLDAMSTLRSINDMYIQDTGSSIVAYLLSNMQSYRGPVAVAIKKELNRRLKNAR